MGQSYEVERVNGISFATECVNRNSYGTIYLWRLTSAFFFFWVKEQFFIMIIISNLL